MIQKKKILVVEDNELNRAILFEILSPSYDVMEAENGLEALGILSRNKDSIALVLLDLMMPVMDGYTFLDELKKNAELSLVPVIVMTQSNSVQDEVAALAHGATDFVPKPYHPDVLLHRVASIIKLRETAALVNQFRFDRLTGLYSKEYFYQKVQERLLEHPEEDYSIISSNIENFKLFNDAMGTLEGDRLLQEVAGMVKELFGGTGFCCRSGADRFLCLQKRELELPLRNSLRHLPLQHNSQLLDNVVMRWGIYEITDDSVPVEQMCDRALLAADSIKGQYNQFYAVYDDSLRSALLRERDITAVMETALEEKQFLVYLQPKYNLREECLAGAEALARWVHPKLGFISPGEFIPLFEKNGFIFQLDQYIWDQVCAQLRQWQDKGYPLVPVSVNVSRADVYRLNLVETLVGITQKYGIDPGYLHLEITESAYTGDSAKIFSVVDQLRKQGFIIEMDDFGSGYSSLNMLSQMRVDILKLDMKITQNEIAKSPENSILNDLIVMAHRMHLSVVAEGIETQEQMNRLREVDCDYVQGYFFAKPMPVPEFERLLTDQNTPKEQDPLTVQRRESSLRSLLVIDEDAGYRARIRKSFGEEYQVREAFDEKSALDCIQAHGPEEIAAVLLSMTLPANGAAGVLKALRQTPRFWKIPVLSTIPNGSATHCLPLASETDDFFCKCHPLFDLNRRIHRLTEVAALRRRQSILQAEARQDPLTGVFNRRGLQSAVSTLREEDLPLAVCLFDLDDMKKTNDSMGHDMGDRMLRAFADALCSQTRSADFRCRYGGDEFLLVLRHVTSTKAVVEKCNQICQAFHDILDAEGFHTTCSSGAILCTEYEALFEEQIARADRALYRAKRENRGHCCLWSPEQDG